MTITPDPHSCPDPEVLMLFLEGKLTGAAHDYVSSHLKICSDCVFVLGETSRFLEEREEPGVEDDPQTARFVTVRRLAAAAAVVLTAGTATWQWLHSRDPVSRIAAAARSASITPVEGRLHGFPHARFEAPRGGEATYDDGAELRAIARMVAEDPDLPRDAVGLHARGVAELLRGNPRAAIIHIAGAGHRSPREPVYWSDLAVARIALARAEGGDAPLQAAIADADRALALDARDVTALFNRAVARERLGMREEAVVDFRRAAALEPGSPWAEEASARARDLSR